MVPLYWFATLVGWPFVLFFLFFGGDVDADFEADFDADLDLDADVDVGEGAEIGAGSGPLAAILSFLSFRSLVFFSAFFGVTGLLLTWLDTSAVVTLVLALALGAFAMWVNRMLMNYLKRTSSDSTIRDRDIAGAPAKVVLPIGPGQRGRIAVEVRGQQLYFTASPFSASDETTFDVGASVVVVEIEEGAAKVAALDMLE